MTETIHPPRCPRCNSLPGLPHAHGCPAAPVLRDQVALDLGVLPGCPHRVDGKTCEACRRQVGDP